MGKNDKKLIRNSTAEFLVFTAQAGEESVEARYEDETVWLSRELQAGNTVSPVGDASVARVCDQGIRAGSEADGEWFISRGMQK